MKLAEGLFLTVLIFASSVCMANDQNDKAFVKQANTKGSKVFYHIDFTQLTERFQKVYFITRLNQHEEIVIVDSDIQSDAFKVYAMDEYPETHVKAILDGLKETATRKSESLNADQKIKWLERNDKYNK